jgi:hypothetical protein
MTHRVSLLHVLRYLSIAEAQDAALDQREILVILNESDVIGGFNAQHHQYPLSAVCLTAYDSRRSDPGPRSRTT